MSADPHFTGSRQNIVFVYATRIILIITAFSNEAMVRCELHNVSGIAVNTLLVGYPNPNPK